MADKIEFKPSLFNLEKTTSNGLKEYKELVKKGIDSASVELGKIHPLTPDYMKWMVDNPLSNTGFLNTEGMRQFWKPWSSAQFSQLQVYWPEVVGPIFLMEKKPKIFPSSSVVYIPGTGEGAYDFKVNDSEISVKAPSGKTNLLKPQFVLKFVGDDELIESTKFKKKVASEGSTTVKKIYSVFEVLAENDATWGPIKVVYGTTGGNGQLSKVLKKQAPSGGPPLICDPKAKDKKAQKAYQQYHSQDVQNELRDWSKGTVAVAVKLFMNLFLKYSGLTLLKLKIDKKTGVGDMSWGSNVTSAYIDNKGRATTKGGKKYKGERMGIQFEFDDNIYEGDF